MCKAEWPGNKFVGERAITTTEQYMQGRRRSGNTAPPRQSSAGVDGHVNGDAGEDAGVEQEEEEEEEEAADES